MNHALLSTLPRVQQGSDPGHEARGQAADQREAADEAEPERGPGDGAALEPDDVGAVHDEHVVGEADPHRR